MAPPYNSMQAPHGRLLLSVGRLHAMKKGSTARDGICHWPSMAQPSTPPCPPPANHNAAATTPPSRRARHRLRRNPLTTHRAVRAAAQLESSTRLFVSHRVLTAVYHAGHPHNLGYRVVIRRYRRQNWGTPPVPPAPRATPMAHRPSLPGSRMATSATATNPALVRLAIRRYVRHGVRSASRARPFASWKAPRTEDHITASR